MINKEASLPRQEVNAQTLIASWEKDLDTRNKKIAEKVFQVGEFSPYSKEARPVKWDAFRDASYEWITNPGAFLKNIGSHVRKIDADFRGGRDYGDANERLERAGEYAKIIALFTAFDYVTSKPLEVFLKSKMKKGDTLTSDDVKLNAELGAFKKLIEVMNDKYATALGNMYVEKKSGKRGYIHEVADKGADTIQTGYPKTLNDLVNGATLESYIRLVSQVPIAGALFEQGTTRLARWQEQSALHTATGKMLYMALGIFIRERRVAGKMDAEELTEAAARLMI